MWESLITPSLPATPRLSVESGKRCYTEPIPSESKGYSVGKVLVSPISPSEASIPAYRRLTWGERVNCAARHHPFLVVARVETVLAYSGTVGATYNVLDSCSAFVTAFRYLEVHDRSVIIAHDTRA